MLFLVVEMLFRLSNAKGEDYIYQGKLKMPALIMQDFLDKISGRNTFSKF